MMLATAVLRSPASGLMGPEAQKLADVFKSLLNQSAVISEVALNSRSSSAATESHLGVVAQEHLRAQRLGAYLEAVARAGKITDAVKRASCCVWMDLHGSMNNTLRVPSACPAPDSELMYTWRNGEHYLELEIFPEGPAEFFYKNRQTGELWEWEYDIGSPIPNEVKNKLSLFTYV